MSTDPHPDYEDVQDIPTMTVRGIEFKIRTSAGHDSLTFATNFNGRTYAAADWQTLRTQLMRVTKVAQAEVSVPFVTLSGVRGVARGLKAGNESTILVTLQGRKDTVQAYDQHLDDMSDADLKELDRLAGELNQAERAYKEFVKAHKFDLRMAVTAAINATDSTEADLAARPTVR